MRIFEIFGIFGIFACQPSFPRILPLITNAHGEVVCSSRAQLYLTESHAPLAAHRMHGYQPHSATKKVKLYKVRHGTAEAFVYSLRFRRPCPNRLMCTLCAKSCVRCTVSHLKWLMCT